MHIVKPGKKIFNCQIVRQPPNSNEVEGNDALIGRFHVYWGKFISVK